MQCDSRVERAVGVISMATAKRAQQQRQRQRRRPPQWCAVAPRRTAQLLLPLLLLACLPHALAAGGGAAAAKPAPAATAAPAAPAAFADFALPLPAGMYNPSLVAHRGAAYLVARTTRVRRDAGGLKWIVNRAHLCALPDARAGLARAGGAWRCAPFDPWRGAHAECRWGSSAYRPPWEATGVDDTKLFLWPGRGVWAITGRRPAPPPEEEERRRAGGNATAGWCKQPVVWRQYLIQLAPEGGDIDLTRWAARPPAAPPGVVWAADGDGGGDGGGGGAPKQQQQQSQTKKSKPGARRRRQRRRLLAGVWGAPWEYIGHHNQPLLASEDELLRLADELAAEAAAARRAARRAALEAGAAPAHIVEMAERQMAAAYGASAAAAAAAAPGGSGGKQAADKQQQKQQVLGPDGRPVPRGRLLIGAPAPEARARGRGAYDGGDDDEADLPGWGDAAEVVAPHGVMSETGRGTFLLRPVPRQQKRQRQQKRRRCRRRRRLMAVAADEGLGPERRLLAGDGDGGGGDGGNSGGGNTQQQLDEQRRQRQRRRRAWRARLEADDARRYAAASAAASAAPAAGSGWGALWGAPPLELSIADAKAVYGKRHSVYEKNWMPLALDDDLYVIYSVGPRHRAYRLRPDGVAEPLGGADADAAASAAAARVFGALGAPLDKLHGGPPVVRVDAAQWAAEDPVKDPRAAAAIKVRSVSLGHVEGGVDRHCAAATLTLAGLNSPSYPSPTQPRQPLIHHQGDAVVLPRRAALLDGARRRQGRPRVPPLPLQDGAGAALCALGRVRRAAARGRRRALPRRRVRLGARGRAAARRRCW